MENQNITQEVVPSINNTNNISKDLNKSNNTSSSRVLTQTEILYMMSCYCYIHASSIGFKALKELNSNFVNISTLSNPDIAQNLKQSSEEVTKADAEISAIEGEEGSDIMKEILPPGAISD